MEAERRKIQEHNQQVLLATEKQIRHSPLFFSGDTARVEAIPLPDLWCNSSDRRDQKRDRFSLVFLTTEPERNGTIHAKLSIVDQHKKGIAAIRDWDFRLLGGKCVQIRSGVDTSLGYEGNGYATALMRLNDAVIEHTIEEILADKSLFLGRSGQDIPWFSVISDAAVTASEDRPDLSRRDDVAVTRKNWTNQTTALFLPDFFSDKQELKRRLGFLPDDGDTRTGDYFKVYR